MNMWQHAGELAQNCGFDEPEKLDTPVEVDGSPYLIAAGYLVPYFAPSDTGKDRRRRERLNIELCDRVFRISDIRDVARPIDDAIQAIAVLMAAYENDQNKQRGVGRVLFGRITSLMRDLSREYIERSDERMFTEIQRLYSYVMVEHRELFECVRLYDLSEDCDGIIEEAFSEIGKPSRQSLGSIYRGRVLKIGQAMQGINEVQTIIDDTLGQIALLPLGEATRTLDTFARTASRLVGIPSSDHASYDPVAASYVNLHDAAREAAGRIDHLNVGRGRSHHIADWLFTGIKLIDSMQNIRDSRKGSIARYRTEAQHCLKASNVA